MVDERHPISTLARNLVTKLRVLTYHLDRLTSGILLNGESTATRDSAPVFSIPNLPYECDDHYLILSAREEFAPSAPPVPGRDP